MLSFENNAVKNTIYKALRDIDEIDVNILDLVNARKSMATSLIQTAKTMRNSIDDMRYVCFNSYVRIEIYSSVINRISATITPK